MADADQIRDNILSHEMGFHVLRGFYSPYETQWIRENCQRFRKRGPFIHTRINTNSMRDYAHPRSHDGRQRTLRIYRYFHNHQQDRFGVLMQRAMKLRWEVEFPWRSDLVYRDELDTMQDYMIVTSYHHGTGMLPVHRDYEGPAPFPLTQFWVLLSQPGTDYRHGNLILHSMNGTQCRVECDLGLQAGDAVVFDKSLEHEVEVTYRGITDVGRWTILIGARAQLDSHLLAMAKRILFSQRVFPLTVLVRRMCRRRAA